MTSRASYYERYWTDFHPTGAVSYELQRVFAEVVEPDSDWLDVGCGDGRTSGPWLRERGCNYTGCDISENAVAEAREIGLNALVIEDAGELPFADHSFDGVACIEVFEHLFEPQQAAREIRRVLRPGGVLVAACPNVAYWRRRLELLAGRFDPIGDHLSLAAPWRDPHIRFFTAKTLTRMLTQAGFGDVRVRGHAGCFLGAIPKVGRKLSHGRISPFYLAAQRRYPMLGERLLALAT